MVHEDLSCKIGAGTFSFSRWFFFPFCRNLPGPLSLSHMRVVTVDFFFFFFCLFNHPALLLSGTGKMANTGIRWSGFEFLVPYCAEASETRKAKRKTGICKWGLQKDTHSIFRPGPRTEAGIALI